MFLRATLLLILSSLFPAVPAFAASPEIIRPKVVVVAMFEAGAWGYLVKSSASEELIRAIRAVANDEKYVSPSVASAVVDRFVLGARAPQKAPVSDLSPREREVLQLLAEGLTSKEIAQRLSLAVSTVETHRKQIMSKLELRSVAELTKFAIRAGLTTVE